MTPSDERIEEKYSPEAARCPVEAPGRTDRLARPEAGVGLALSGGGYRAMLFHLGALWRMNEAGWLPRLDRIAGVSGGAITAAALGAAWGRLGFGEEGVGRLFSGAVADPVLSLADETLDAGAVVTGLLGPGSTSERLAGGYDDHLFHRARTGDLPGRPEIVIVATSVQTGLPWTFGRDRTGGPRVGEARGPDIRLADAVAASTAFPPVLSPAVVELDPAAFDPEGGDLAKPPFTARAVLADGGVYDNLGLETVWTTCRTVLVSDAGMELEPEGRPKRDWPRHAWRVVEVIDHQVRTLRKRQAVAGFVAGDRDGAYWGIRSDITHFPLDDPLPCPRKRTVRLARTPTRLARLPRRRRERLVNWGYAACDAALRAHVDPSLPNPAGFPYADAAV